MTFVTAVRLVVLAVIAGFGGGFAWGVADHRGIEAVANFADQHIVFPKPDPGDDDKVYWSADLSGVAESADRYLETDDIDALEEEQA